MRVPFEYLNSTFETEGLAYGDQYVLLSVRLYTKLPLAEFIIQNRYTAFGSSTIQYINESSEYFTIPFGSTDTFYVLDPWGGVVGIQLHVFSRDRR